MSALENLENLEKATKNARGLCGKFSTENLADVPNEKLGAGMFTATEAILTFEDLLQSIEASIDNPQEVIKYVTNKEMHNVASTISVLSSIFSSKDYPRFVATLDTHIIYFRPFAMLSMEKMDNKRYKDVSRIGTILQEMEIQTAKTKTIIDAISQRDKYFADVIYATKSRIAELDAPLSSAQANIVEIQKLHNDAVDKSGEITTTSESAQKIKDQLVAHETRAEDKNIELEKMLGKFKSSLENHEEKMKSQTQEAEKMITTAREALHLTTARGLSAAFDTQAQNLGHKNVKFAWLGFGVAASIIASILGVLTISDVSEWYTAFLRFLLMSIFLGLSAFAFRQYSKNKSLEYDYAFKSALVSSYPGISDKLDDESRKEYVKRLMLEILRDPQRVRNGSAHKEATSSVTKLASGGLSNTDK